MKPAERQEETIILVCFIFGGMGNGVDARLRLKIIISFYVYSKVFDRCGFDSYSKISNKIK